MNLKSWAESMINELSNRKKKQLCFQSQSAYNMFLKKRWCNTDVNMPQFHSSKSVLSLFSCSASNTSNKHGWKLNSV